MLGMKLPVLYLRRLFCRVFGTEGNNGCLMKLLDAYHGCLELLCGLVFGFEELTKYSQEHPLSPPWLPVAVSVPMKQKEYRWWGHADIWAIKSVLF